MFSDTLPQYINFVAYRTY